ncbi:induced myeloid leukemia cell differentiation protein Mcl-1b [Brachyistius frenatus]|uniref:induced myeloid leukemia cell differentiation protein Mcl-1b n=1 Tax=Brachyistius frenatus TaxID=100188 RepID=UPI0037E79254
MNIIPPTKRAALVGCLILPQNGVTNGSMRYGSRGSSIDSRNANVGSGDVPKRPKNLGVTATNGYAAKGPREGSGGVDESSLPGTPELEMDSGTDVSGFSAGDEVLDHDTRQLILRFLKDFTGLSKPQWNQSKSLSTMKRVVEDVLEKHRLAYNGMVNKLSLDDRGDDVTFVTAVAKNLFADGTTNWGRIASLVAFGAVVCQYQKDRNRENCVELVCQEISTYLLTNQRDWLVKNNSWDGFVEFFRVADPEATVRNTLMAFAGFAGIGATLALLIR